MLIASVLHSASHHETEPSGIFLMMESQATSGSDSPRHAEFRFLPPHKSRFGFSTRFLCSRGCVAFVSRAVMVLLVWFLASLMSCFLDRVVGRRSSLPGGPFSFLFLRGWNRHRRKGVRGSGSQEETRRGAKPRRIAFAFKVPSDTLFGWGTRWLMGFIPFLITLLQTGRDPRCGEPPARRFSPHPHWFLSRWRIGGV